MKRGRKAQVSLFVILAIIIVASIGIYFAVRGQVFTTPIPANIQPAYDYYLSCIEDDVKNGVSLMGAQAGYIQTPDFEAGSDYMPFSNKLDFLGMGIPYWYYISGNNIAKEQIPTKGLMEEQLADYLNDKINECDFSGLREQGYLVDYAEAEFDVKINEEDIQVKLKQFLNISFSDTTAVINSHELGVKSNLGYSYDLASKIYEHEKNNQFLEKYAIDNLRLYAPVDGFEISCNPKVWSVPGIREELQQAIEGNTMAIKVKGDYYTLRNKDNNYFVQDIGEQVGGKGESVNFLFVNDFPFKMEVYPNEGATLVAKPVGLQPELGALGFCFVGYHYVYDLAYPVLVQIYTGEELFQFPVGVAIDDNTIWDQEVVAALPGVEKEMCKDDRKLTEMEVTTYDNELNPIEAEVKFRCFSTSCDIGSTVIEGDEASLVENFPQCVNGFILANAPGYKEEKYQISTVNEGFAEIILEKEYEMDVEVGILGRTLGRSSAIVDFRSGDEGFTLSYPIQNKVNITQGLYNVTVYIYEDASLNFDGASTRKCIEVPEQGLGYLLGNTREQCFDLDVPEQVVSQALTAGGSEALFVSNNDLKSNNKMRIIADDFGVPSSLDKLQENYDKLEEGTVLLEYF